VTSFLKCPILFEERWSLTLRKEQTLGGVHEQRAEESIWNKEEVTESRRNLHSEELHTMHSSPVIIILLEL
jgi:hypothetical protein